jgi:hypothetical protein
MANENPPPPDPRRMDFYAPRDERFDVVLCKDGVGHHAAAEGDFKRISVQTDRGAAGARNLPEVEALEKEGYNIVSVVPPGLLTEGERMARQRAHDDTYGAFDRTKV